MICLWVNKRDWRHPGPILNVGLRNAHSLAAAGIETHLCCGAGDASDTERDLGEFYDLSPEARLRIHRVPRWEVGRHRLSLAIFWRAYRLARSLACRDRVAVLTREPGFLPFLAWLCRDGRIRGFYEAHNFLADLSWREGSAALGERREGWIERRFLPRVSGLVAITESQRRLYEGVFPQLPACTLPLGTSPKPPDEGEIERRRQLRVLVYVGHLHGFKGVSTLLGAAGKLATRQRVRTLLVGGAAQQIERFRGRARVLEKAGAVEFRPFLPPAELEGVLAREASLGAVLLEDTFYNRNLTCPAKALDYLSHGLPVLATDLPSNRDLLGPAGLFTESQKAFRRVVVSLLESPEAYAAAARASIARAKELSWDRRAQRLAAFIDARFGRTSPAPSAA
jgi:glycosyltransferase involved in cell wall biosynthesis